MLISHSFEVGIWQNSIFGVVKNSTQVTLSFQPSVCGGTVLDRPGTFVAMNDAWHRCVLYTVANYSGMAMKIQVFTELCVCLLKC